MLQLDLPETTAALPEPLDALPELRGTVNQVPWATHVRAKLAEEVERHLRDWWRKPWPRLRDSGKAEAAEREGDAYREALDAWEGIRAQEYSGWWLDRRENTARELLHGAEPRPGGLRR